MKTVSHHRFKVKSLFDKKVTGGFDGGKISSDAGGLLLSKGEGESCDGRPFI